MEENEIFTVLARRCKRCGGLLTSEKAVKDGYGHTCKMKAIADKKALEIDRNQIIFDFMKNYDEDVHNHD